MEIGSRTVENAKRRILDHFTPGRPGQDDCLDSGLVGLMDYRLYEGADVRELLFDLAEVISDILASRTQKVEARIEDGQNVVLTTETMCI